MRESKHLIVKVLKRLIYKPVVDRCRGYIRRKDEFTGVYSRDYFFRSIESKKNGTFIKIKLIGINFVNLHCGIKVGDGIIKEVASKIKHISQDFAVARIGSAKFAIYTELTNIEEIEKIIKSILSIVGEMNYESDDIDISACIAAVIYKDDGFCIEDAINKIEVSMSNAMKQGKNKYEIYNRKYENYININSIEKAIKDGEIVLYYQPKVATKTGTIEGVEALIRWFNKDYGYIPPDKLIGFAEKSGYINTLGKWIVKRACEDINKLNEKLDRKIDLSVNISPYQLGNKMFIQDIEKIIIDTAFDYKLLKFEITENENIEEIDRIYDIFEEIKKSGIKVSIDDFGKGFNSIDYIKNYNVDEIKIDKSLVEYINKNPMFIKNLINMIHTTGTSVVAEGVEQQVEYNALKNMGCDFIQGYYCYKPMELEQLIGVMELNIS